MTIFVNNTYKICSFDIGAAKLVHFSTTSTLHFLNHPGLRYPPFIMHNSHLNFSLVTLLLLPSLFFLLAANFCYISVIPFQIRSSEKLKNFIATCLLRSKRGSFIMPKYI